jgi:purine-nucleoside phosphorylase
MYKSLSADDFRKEFKLGDDYSVKGFLSYGAWDDEKHTQKIQDILRELNIDFSITRKEGFLSRIVEININKDRYWFVVMYGGTLLSEYIHLACLLGSKKNIHIGSCGGLYPEIDDLNLIIPTWSYGNESTTRAYEREVLDSKHYSDKNLSDLLEMNAKKLIGTNRLWKGPVMTNQAMLGETFEDVQEWSKTGFYGVEMETATMFSVSKHFNVPSAALLYVSDNLIKGQTVGSKSHIKQKELREVIKNNVYKAGLLSLLDDK